MIAIANAPVSYGVFQLSRPDLVTLPDGEQMLAWVREAGYQGIDLGPIGMLGDRDTLPGNLQEHGLALDGGWVDFPFGDGDDKAFEDSLLVLDDALEIFSAAARVSVPELAPKPTIADLGSPERAANPGGGPDVELDDAGWRRLVGRVNEVVRRVRAAGLEPTYHHHACTYIETPAEIDRLLEDTDVDLTFDTGHLLIGGGDPRTDFSRWRERINHLHLKDADLAVLPAALSSAAPLQYVWENRAFCSLGEGNLDLEAILEEVLASDYSGWLVVEQDVIPRSAEEVDRARRDQVANLSTLRQWLK